MSFKLPRKTTTPQQVPQPVQVQEPSTPPTSVPTLGRGRMPILRPISKPKRKFDEFSAAAAPTETAAATSVTVQEVQEIGRSLFGHLGQVATQDQDPFGHPRFPERGPTFSFDRSPSTAGIQAGTPHVFANPLFGQVQVTTEPLHLTVQRLEMRLDVVTKLLNVTMAQQLQNMQLL